MKKRRKGFLFTYILAALGGGILIGAALLWFFTDSNMYKTGYVPMHTVMRKAGYVPVSTQDAAVCYGDTQSDTLLRVEHDYRTVTKDDFVYTQEDAFSIALKKLYVRRTFIEQVLDISVSRSYPVGYNVTVHPPVTGEDLTAMQVPFIAHAGGGSIVRNEEGLWETVEYVNSLETLCASYRNGFRAIETDLLLSSDSIFCAIHNWKTLGGIRTADDFLQMPTPDGGTPLLLEDVLRLVNMNRDLILVLDIKSYEWTMTELEANYHTIVDMAMEIGGEALVNRIVPQLYHPEEYEIVKSVYPWKALIFSLYREKELTDDEVLAVIADKPDIRIVTCKTNRMTEELARGVHALGRQLFVYTVNDIDGLYKWINKGVDGFYTDLMTPQTWLERYAK
ncbi:MAG: hypothetical protein IKE03_10605 [Blautia sp.]|nr:hypothetical protein [Blautia sp.]